MIVHLKQGVGEKGLEKVLNKAEEIGICSSQLDISQGDTCVIGIKGDTSKVNEQSFENMSEVEKVIRITEKWKALSKKFHPEYSVIELPNGVKVGKDLVIIAGPCAVESYEQVLETAKIVKAAGANALRGGAYKPRTSRLDFQGLEEEGLNILARVKKETGLPIVTEIMDKEDIPLFEKYGVDIYQVGARNCQNFRLLKALSRIDKPVLLKRGSGITLNEYLNAADYIYSGNGKANPKVILCERGDKSYDPEHRNVLNINNIVYLKKECHLPVIADPSHAGGKRDMVISLAKASIAAGADGLIVEVHYDPDNALCDGAQSLTKPYFSRLVKDIDKIFRAR